MRSVLRWTSLLSILASAACLALLNLSKVENRLSPEDISFPAFPKDRIRWVAFGTDSDGYQTLSRREKEEQQRDWLLYAVVTSSNLPVVDMERALFDIVPIRSDTLTQLGRIRTGRARSCVIGSGRTSVVAVIPKADTQVQADLLVDIADEQRKNTGGLHERVYIFEYEIAGNGEEAAVKFTGVRPGTDFFSKDFGYVEQPIRSESDLIAFLEATDDIVSARLDGTTLVMGGRKLKAHHIQGIGVDEIATIWQSSQKDPDLLGFSLDPQIDKEALRINFSLLGVTIRPQKPNWSDLMYSMNLGAAGRRRFPGMQQATDPNAYLNEYRKALTMRYGDVRSSEELDQAFRKIVKASRFQKARYDGDFKGTEVGMVLFYTDLLMKLWGQDQLGSTPTDIAEFPNCLTLNPASVHEQETRRLKETRLWLALQDTALQKDITNNALYFARVATRIFAVPHDSIDNRDLQEAEPNIFDRIFMGWWNSHYAEVARFEPQYERLNQIIKWSAVIGWLQAQWESAALSFLESVTVHRDYWFTDWVKSRPELTFREWDRLDFLEKGYQRIDTEALEIQYSRPFEAFGGMRQYSGGVSLAGKSKLRELKPLIRELDMSMRRGGMSAAKTKRGTWNLISHGGNSYETSGINAVCAKSLIKPGEKVRLRGLTGEIAPGPFERTLARNVQGAEIQYRSGGMVVGDLHITRSANGLKVGWQARDLDATYALARDISGAVDPEAALFSSPDIAGVVKRTEGEYLAQLRVSHKWVLLRKQSDSGKQISEGFAVRASGGPDAPIYEATLINSAELNNHMNSLGFVEIRTSGPASDRAMITQAARPPPAARKVTIQSQGRHIEAYSDGKRGYVQWSALTPELRSDTLHLTKALGLKSADAAPVPMAAEFAARSYSQIADRLSQDPKFFLKALNRSMDAQEHLNAMLWKNGKIDELRRQIGLSERLFGDLPEFRIQTALAQLEDGMLETAAHTLNRGVGRPAKRAGAFLHEMEARLSNPDLDLVSRANLQAVRDYTEFSARAKPGIKLTVQAEHQRLGIVYETANIPKTKYTRTDAAAFQDVPIYVEDSPGLNIADWSPGNVPSRLRDWIQHGQVEINAIKDVELSALKPSVLVETKTGKQYHLSEVKVRHVTPAVRLQECLDQDHTNPDIPERPCLALLVRRGAIQEKARN